MTRDARVIFTAEDRMAPAVASAKKGLGTVAEAAGAAGLSLAALGTAGSLAGVVALVKKVNDSVDALNDIKDASGSTIENISALEDVARRNGHAFDAVSTSLVKFNQVLGDTQKPGGEAEKILKSIGLNAKTLREMDPAEALLQTAIAFDKFADDGNKARAMQELFGKSLREISPFLKDLAEQGRLNATVTTQQAEEAERFNKELGRMNASLQDVGRALTGDVVRGINAAAKAWKESGLLEGLRTLLTGDDQHKNNVRLVELTDQLLRAQNRLSASKEKDKKFQDRSLETAAAERELANIQRQLATVQAYRAALTTTVAEAPKPGMTPPKEPDKKAEAAAKAAAAATLREAQRVAEERQKLRNKEYDEIEKFFFAQEELSVKAAAAQRELAAKNSEEYLAGIDAQVRATQAAVAAAEWEVETFGKSKVQIAELTLAKLEAARTEQLMTALTLKDIEAIDAQIAAQKRLISIYGRGEIQEANAKAAEEAKREWDQVGQSLTDSLMTGGKNAAQYLKDLFRTLVLRPMLAPVGQAMSGLLGGVMPGGGAATGSGFGGLLNTGGSLLSNLGGLGSIGATLSSASYAAAVPGLTSFGAGSQAAMLAAQTSGFGAAGLGATASAGGSALGGAIGSIGAAMPYIGAAVVAAMVAKQLFDQGGGPKSEGAAGTLGMLSELGQRGSSDARSRQSANAARASISDQYAQLAAMYGIRDKYSFGVGFSADPEGNAPSFAEVTATRGGKVVHSTGSANLARGEEAMAINLADFSAKTILKALQDSGLKDGIGEYLRELGDIDKLSRGSTTNALARIQKAGAEKQALEERMFALTATSAQQLARARKQELSGLDETNRAMLKRIHSLEDEAVATAQRQTLEDRYAQLTMTTSQLLARERKREIAETDKSNVSLLKRIHKLEDERAAQEKASESIAAAAQSSRAAAQYLSDLKTSLGQYIDQLKGGPGGMLAPEQQLSNAKSQFERQLKLARGGDREALGSITTYADQLIQAQTQWTASGPQTAKIIAYVMEQLAKLPKSVDQKALAKVPAYADGGYHPGGHAWVGERGKELVFFNQPARVVSAEQSRSMVSAGGRDDARLQSIERAVLGLTSVVAAAARRQIEIEEKIERNTAGSRPQQILATVRGGGR